MPATPWSPAQYSRFEDERNRPPIDLIARIPLERPARIVDIGCGPGNSTELLLARYPGAEVTGLDSSPDMIAAARQRLPATRFVQADVAQWTPEPGVELLFSNATFQWVPRHRDVLRRLMGGLPAGGVLAFQVPDNLGEPSHTLMRDVALAGPWREKFAEPTEREEIAAPAAYYDLLRPEASAVDIWTTTYNHPLAGPRTILEMILGTGLRPYLGRLEESERAAFLADYEARLTEAYPPLVDGKVLLRFPRLFVVATRG